MWIAGLNLNRIILAILLLVNAVAFAGVDPFVRTITAALVLVLALGNRQLPAVLPLHRVAAFLVACLLIIQLVPLPSLIRKSLQPGFSEFMHAGWAPLSLAPWATLQTVASFVIAAGIALAAARMAATRSGLPTLLVFIAGTGVILAALGLAGETGSPNRVLFLRSNVAEGLPYGPFLNHNHFGLAIELTLPAAAALLLVAIRHIRMSSGAIRSAIVISIGASAAIAVSLGALLRCRSRGGLLFLVVGFVLTLPLWRRGHERKRRIAVLVVILAVGASTLALFVAQTQLPHIKETFTELFLLDGARNNSRWELWDGTFSSWKRSPIVGSGAGSYRHVIDLDKPATGANRLHQAHNDWLEWASTTGVLGLAILGLAVVGIAMELRPARLSRFRFEYRYPMAAAAFALTSVALHETIGFGLQIPLNRYLLACWIGMIWGATAKLRSKRRRQADEGAPHSSEAASSG